MPSLKWGAWEKLHHNQETVGGAWSCWEGFRHCEKQAGASYGGMGSPDPTLSICEPRARLAPEKHGLSPLAHLSPASLGHMG